MRWQSTVKYRRIFLETKHNYPTIHHDSGPAQIWIQDHIQQYLKNFKLLYHDNLTFSLVIILNPKHIPQTCAKRQNLYSIRCEIIRSAINSSTLRIFRQFFATTMVRYYIIESALQSIDFSLHSSTDCRSLAITMLFQYPGHPLSISLFECVCVVCVLVRTNVDSQLCLCDSCNIGWGNAQWGLPFQLHSKYTHTHSQIPHSLFIMQATHN